MTTCQRPPAMLRPAPDQCILAWERMPRPIWSRSGGPPVQFSNYGTSQATELLRSRSWRSRNAIARLMRLCAAAAIALRRSEIAWFHATQIDDQFLQYDSRIYHPELQSVIARSCQYMHGRHLTHAVRYRLLPIYK